MDIVNTVRGCLKNWSRGGDSECRNMLIAPHCNSTDPNCLDVLTTAYNTLLCATLLTWSPPHPLTPTAFAEFVQSVLRALPSSSSASPRLPPHAVIFGDHLVDLIWSVDTELDELLNEARLATTASGEGKISSKDVATLINKARKAQQNAEIDKQRIPAIVMKLLEFRIISPDHCRERLETAVLASVGLIQDKGAQDKKEIRTRTGLFYKQNKFNLLREQSEGYSKLTVELTSSLGPPHSPQTGRPTEAYSVIEERARPVWEKVISLIGYFDLDPNRALDIILDVLSQHLTTHYSFFLALLSFSPWSGSYRRPLPVNEAMDVNPDIPEMTYRGKNLDEVLTLAEAQVISPATKKSGGARVLAQVLGFKFSYYQSADVSEHTPRNLFHTAAILIREGFIALEDLYPHLSPKDENMDAFREEYLADVRTRISGAKSSLLAMAAPLESGPSSSQSKALAAAPPEPKKLDSKSSNQKVGLLTSLLAVGALKPAIAIMSKFRWLVDANPEIADLMIRILKISISALYDSKFSKERNPSFNRPKARYGPSGLVQPNPRKPVLTLWAPVPPSTNTTDFVFFFPDWADRIPICNSLDDLKDVVEPLLRFIGVQVSRDPFFLTKFVKLGRLDLQSLLVDPITKTRKSILDDDPKHPITTFWFTALRQYLLPSLSLVRGNAVFTVEVWAIIRLYSTSHRWRLYGEWRNTYQSHPELRIRAVQAERESKGILRRLSHNTIDSLSGAVAKMSHSNPCIFFTHAVNQVMAYDNLADVVIQALKNVTNMGFDILVFIAVAALANPGKERVKDDGVNTSDWLQSLASFLGMLFRRYGADLSAVLQYIVHQLSNRQTTEIVVLRELIWKMAGIEPLPTLSESQMAAMAGGPALRTEALASAVRGARLDPSDIGLKGPQRLGKNLLESSLALPLLIQVAQQRQACVYNAPNAHLKSLAGLYDATHGVLLQYLEVLTSPSVISADDYATKILPPFPELAQVYGICPPICMQIIRPVLNASLLTSALAMQEQERIANEEAEKRLKAALTAKREPGSAASRVASPAIGNSGPSDVPDPKAAAVGEPETAMEVDSVPSAILPKEDSPWLPELAAHFDDIKAIAPGNAYEVIGPGFYLTFWQLSTYDLMPPGSKYDEEGSKLRALSRQEDSQYIAADRSSDRSKRLTAATHRNRRDRYNMFVNILAQEFKEQTISRAFTIKRLAREKQHWFAHSPKPFLLINSIIEHCIQPRCLLSPMDADFCAHFIKILHLQGTPGFHTLNCYDKLLGEHVKVVLFSCSEYEARNYGRFLFGILRDLLSWHLDEATYIQDNRTKISGVPVILPGLQKTFQTNKVMPADVLKWPEFQKVVRKWHRKLAKSFTECIQTGEFMHVYNAIIVMKEILDVFPLASVNDSGPLINTAIDSFVETEERGDLKILARSYSASLKRKEADWASPKLPSHLNGNSPRTLSQSAQSPAPEKPRHPPTGPSAQSTSVNESRRIANQLPSSTPSAPRAQIPNQNTSTIGDKLNSSISSTKLAMESIPRPEVVKRVRPEAKNLDSVKTTSDVTMSLRTEPPPSNDRRGVPTGPAGTRTETSTPDATDHPPRLPAREPQSIFQQGGPTPKDHSESARSLRPPEQPQVRVDNMPVMPPPAVPSQTASAQELRETARQSIGRTDRPEVRNQNGSALSPPIRSPSPSSRPGTRNPSNDSRTSGGKSRSDPGNPDRASDDRREREGRSETREPTGSLGRRDSLTHNRTERNTRDRTGRDGDKDREDRDKDRGRDRHTDRDREKDRDRDRDRERDRDRDRERDRDRDRHRRDDKDRDVRKEREAVPNRSQVAPAPAITPDDRGLPSRPEVSRHRNPLQNGDDGLGKRRRTVEDDPERGSKRTSSRKESHRDDRTRRPPEKEDRNRDLERRRKDRDGPESEVRASSSDKSSDKRTPAETSFKATPTAPLPSGPRAMDRHRDNTPQSKDLPSSGNGPSNQQEGGSRSAASLRSRISDKEPPLSFREAGRIDEERETLRKRSASDREPDINESSYAPVHDPNTQPPKRPRTNNNNNSRGHSRHPHAVAKRLLPIDHSAHDKNQRR